MAGEGDAERLVVLLEARTRDLERQMARASGTTTREYNRMRTGSRSATRQMEMDMHRASTRINTALATTSARMGTFTRVGLGGLAAGFIGTLAPILSVAGAMRGARAAMEEFDNTAKQAKSAGMDAEFFQELAYAAGLGGLEVSQLSSALDQFNANAGLAAVGQGRMVSQLKELNPELLEAIQNTRSQEERLRLVADALDKEADASRKAAIAKAAFGSAGTRMVEVLNGGSAALDQTAAKARELGLVVDRDLLARAEELNDEFTTVSRVLNVQFQQALINLAPFLIQTAQLAAQLANVIRDIGDAIHFMTGSLDAVSVDNLEGRLRTLGAERIRLDNMIQREQSNLMPEGSPSRDFQLTEIRMIREELRKVADEERHILDLLEERANRKVETAPSLIDPDDIEDFDTGGGGRAARAAGAIKEAEAVAALIEKLEIERELIGMSASEQAKMNALREAGSEATEEQKQRIIELIDAIANEQAAAQLIMEDEAPWDLMHRQLEGLESMLERGAISWEQYGQAAALAMANAASATLGAIGQQTSMLASAFENNKALSIANAVVAGGEAIANSFAAGTKIGGPPMGFAFAATAAAASMAQVASIASASPSSKSLNPGGINGGSEINPQAQMPAEQTLVNITLNGTGYSRDQVRELIEALNNGISNGMELIVKP